MKFIYTADNHLRSSRPVNRIDDYQEAQMRKFTQLLNWADIFKAAIFCGGDFLDSPTMSFKMFNRIQDELLLSERKIFTVIGNHEIYFANEATLNSTTLYSLEASGRVEILSGPTKFTSNVIVHGVGWEQEVPKPIPGKTNILLGHISVFEKEVPFYWKGEGYTAKSLKKTYPGFDYYLCGDIHIPFVKDNVVVSGSMMRQNIDQADLKPRAYLIDTVEDTIEPLYFDIEKDVFTATPKLETVDSTQFDGLVAALKESGRNKASYTADCFELAEGDSELINTLQEIFDHARKA